MCKLYHTLVVASSALIMGGMAAIILPNIDRLSPGDNLGGNYPASLRFVGTGKNWTSAGMYCDQLGMRLASITSSRQVALLNQSHADHFNGYFWTSGRDIHELSQFAWNATGECLSSDYLSVHTHRRGYLTCVEYYSNAEVSRLDSEECSHIVRILCETLPIEECK